MYIDVRATATWPRYEAAVFRRAGLGRVFQPMTLLFKMGGVDFDSVRAYVKAHPEVHQAKDRTCRMSPSPVFDTAHAKAAGTLTVNRDRVLLFQGSAG